MLFLQLLRESFLFAFSALNSNRLRTFLSLLGITIGIFIIITVFTIVDSLERNLQNSVMKLGNNVIYVQKWPFVTSSNFPWWKIINRPSPSYKDFEQLEHRVDNAEAMAFSIYIDNQLVKYGNNSVENAYISAVSQNFDKVRTIDIEDGRYFSPIDSRSGRNYAIIGKSIASGLFENLNPIGRDIKVKGRKLQVIGVIKKEGNDIFDNTTDNGIFIPINFARNIVDTRRDRFQPTITVKARQGVGLDELENDLKGSMRAVRRLSPHQEDNFALNKASILSLQLKSLFRVVDIAGWIIGGFSILVGGFGIANIMFVSVKERTHIIGIQKSLGAKNYFIRLQFLVESMILCLIGGVIGLLMVFLISLLASQALDLTMSMSMGNILTGIIVSASIGIISGYMPALAASRLDPVEAIRSN